MLQALWLPSSLSPQRHRGRGVTQRDYFFVVAFARKESPLPCHTPSAREGHRRLRRRDDTEAVVLHRETISSCVTFARRGVVDGLTARWIPLGMQGRAVGIMGLYFFAFLCALASASASATFH